MGFEVFRSAGAPLPGSAGRVDAQEAIDWDSPVSPLDQIRDKGLLSGFYGDFNPAARELGQAVRKRESRAARMLARLKCGPATTLEMMTLGGAGFSSRLRELRNAGHRITCEQHVHEGSEWAIYRIEEGA
jgi:hypothetical protein